VKCKSIKHHIYC